MNKKAVLIGATGATGMHLLRGLLEHEAYQSVTVLTRRTTGVTHSKLTEHIVDFDHPEKWSELVTGDELFSALGTTLKAAGSREAQYKVDVTYQRCTAEAAKHNGIERYLLVSSPGADHGSWNFYLKMKGKLDRAIKALEFRHCVLIKPSIIDSERPDSRPGERFAARIIPLVSPLLFPLRKYQPIKAADLAAAIINIAQSDLQPGVTSVELDKIFQYV